MSKENNTPDFISLRFSKEEAEIILESLRTEQAFGANNPHFTNDNLERTLRCMISQVELEIRAYNTRALRVKAENLG